MKRFLQSLWVSLLIVSSTLPLMGCQSNENEAGVASTAVGTADPRYAKGDDAAYRAHYEDAQKAKTQGKTGKSAPK
jgi:hypothetical protein